MPNPFHIYVKEVYCTSDNWVQLMKLIVAQRKCFWMKSVFINNLTYLSWKKKGEFRSDDDNLDFESEESRPSTSTADNNTYFES